MIDGYILSRMQTIPVSLLPETGNQIKFCQFYHDFTGKDLDYPPVRSFKNSLRLVYLLIVINLAFI